ncbi:hypothetical protein [Aromatoleum anaerobium]|uniref:hypothetical protein n=1 Tax=Aromatoleum anaerobium TaxID=182180 RepID=UPI003CCFE990
MRWSPIDNRRALATLSDLGNTVSLEFRFNVKEPTSETSARLTAEGHGVEGRVNQAAARMKPKRVSALIQRGALR